MSLPAIIPSFDPGNDDWCSRREAAQRLHCSERDIPNRVAKGKVVEFRLSQKKKRYYVPKKFYRQGVPALPIETYDEERCFIVWITFSDSCLKSERFEAWNQDMSKMIEDYVRQRIRPDINETTFVLANSNGREHHAVQHQDPIMRLVVHTPSQKPLDLNDRS